MEDLADQLNDFNELHNLGTEFLTQLEDAVKFAEKERDDAKQELTKISSELKNIYAELKKVEDTNKNLSAELAKYQEKLKFVERERDELRGKLDDLRKILVR